MYLGVSIIVTMCYFYVIYVFSTILDLHLKTNLFHKRRINENFAFSAGSLFINEGSGFLLVVLSYQLLGCENKIVPFVAQNNLIGGTTERVNRTFQKKSAVPFLLLFC